MNNDYRISITIIIILSFCINIISTNIILAVEKEVELDVNKTLIGKNDILEVSLIINNKNFAHVNDDTLFNYFRLIEEPEYNFDINDNFLTIKYKLNPISIGRFTIDNIKVFLKNGDIINPNQITISVVEGSLYNNINNQNNNELPPEKRTFLKLITDKDSYYKGETIILSTYLYSIYPIDNHYEYYNGRPTLSRDFWEPGFHDYEIVLSTTTTENIDHIEYEKKLIDRRILFPKFTGNYTFGPYKWKVPFGEKVRDYEQYILQTNTKDITINPLPMENKPEKYNGTVGSFKINSDITGYDYKNQSDIPVYTGNTFVKYIIKLSGRGNPDLVAEPNLKLSNENFEIISLNIIPKERFSDDGYYFTKVYEYLLRPLKEGMLNITGIDYTFFDTENESYKTISTKSFSILNKQKVNNNINKDEILSQTIKKKLKPLKKPDKLNNKNPYLLSEKNVILIIGYNLFIMILIPLSFLIYRKRKHREKNSEKIKQNKAYNNAISTINQYLNKSVEDNKDIYKRMYKILIKYISDRFNLSEGKINKDVIIKILENKKIHDEVIIKFNEYYDKLVSKIYAGSLSQDGNTKSYISLLKEIIRNIEDNI